MMGLCIDTSAYSQFKRGERSAVEAISTIGRLGVPAVVVGELRAGFGAGTKSDRNERELLAFLRHPAVEVLEVDEPASAIYADIVNLLRRAGTPVPTNDIWIAAVAAREGMPVLTFDAHFAKIAAVRVRLLTPREP